MKKHIGVIIFILFFIGCGIFTIYNLRDNVWIAQKIEINSRLDCTYNIETYLWIRIDNKLTIEMSECAYKIPKDQLESIKKSQYNKVYPAYLKAKKLLESNKDICK